MLMPGNNAAASHTAIAVADATARLALTGQPVGTCARQADNNHLFYLLQSPESVPGNWLDCGAAVGEAPAITSANTKSVEIGSALDFTVTATGTPVPVITYTGTLPTGATFTDNGDGTATLAGTVTGDVDDYPLTFTAANGVSPDAGQEFTLTVSAAPGGMVKIYSGALVTPNLSAWSVLFDGTGTLELRGNDVWANTDLSSIDTRSDSTLDGAWTFDGFPALVWVFIGSAETAISLANCSGALAIRAYQLATLASFSVSNCPNAIGIYPFATPATFAFDSLAAVNNIRFDDMPNLTSADVDAIINALNPAVANGLCWGGGTTPARTSASDDNYAALGVAGWTFTNV